MRLSPLLLGLLLAGCGTDDGTPWWAVDSMFMVPDGQGATGTVSWQVYSRSWSRRFKAKHYLCAVVASFDAGPSTADCEACEVAFDVDPVITASDCSDADTDNVLFTATQRIGIGAPGDGPYAGASSLSWVDYGAGWERHGWAYPEAVANGDTPASPTWDGTEPFGFSAIAAWQLQSASNGLTPQSRSAVPPDDE